MKNRIGIMALLGVLFPVLLNGAKFPAQEENTLRVMSYNVRNCKGMDEVVNYERISNVICNLAPDIVALQELDSVTSRSKGVDVLDKLARETLMYPTYGAAINYQGGKYGIGILSKEKPLKVEKISLPGREESRVLLIVEFEKYVLCNTHFSLTPEDQLSSVTIIEEAVKGINKPLILAGDMNSTPDSPTQSAMSKKFTILSNKKQLTFPSDKPKECIDYIYGYGKNTTYSVTDGFVIEKQLASDHLPIFVDIRFKTPKEGVFRTQPFLQNPTKNGITISWLTNVPVHSWVQYGTNENLNQKAETILDGQIVSNNTHHNIRLTNLEPNTTYYYKVYSREITLYRAYKKEFGETASSPIYSFTTPPIGASDFTAIIFNDLHKNKKLVDLLVEQIKDLPYNFVMFNGDCIDDPRDENQVVDFLSYLNAKVGAEKTPVFYLRGNHEIRNAYSLHLRDFFDYVNNKTYGAFNWGDTRFVMLDCGEDKPDSTWVYYNLNDFTSLRNDQIDFLKSELKGKDFHNAQRKVLIHHIPLYGLSDKEYQPCTKLWGDIISKANFDVAINGHTHQFAYIPKNSLGNNFPVVIGGGNRPESGTVMILEKKGKQLTLKVLNTKGETVKILNL